MKLTHAGILLLPIVAMGCSITINSQPPVTGSGVPLTETRSIENFESLSLATSADIVVTCGEEPSLTITGDDNLLPLITTNVVGNRLEIECDQNIRPRTQTTVQLTVPTLSSVSISGSGDITVKGMAATDADFSISGSGSIGGDIAANSLDVSIAGNGDVTCTGSVPRIDISVAGSGDVNLMNVAADNVEVSIAGSGAVAVNAEKSLDVSIVGSGDVTYSGSAQVSKSILGSGSISMAAERP
jgi:carbon monoxide dehydrogenase subunit G